MYFLIFLYIRQDLSCGAWAVAKRTHVWIYRYILTFIYIFLLDMQICIYIYLYIRLDLWCGGWAVAKYTHVWIYT